MAVQVPGGVVHELPTDLRSALSRNATALDAWKDITPLARNEFICWVEDAKQATTRERRIRRTQEELENGRRVPAAGPAVSTASATARPETAGTTEPGSTIPPWFNATAACSQNVGGGSSGMFGWLDDASLVAEHPTRRRPSPARLTNVCSTY